MSTFGLAIGEVALVPTTGGVFNVALTHKPLADDVENEVSNNTKQQSFEIQTVLLWDRKAEGGFPETKVLKQRVRDHIEPKKDLGHSDVGGKKNKSVETQPEGSTDHDVQSEQGKKKLEKKLEDCATCP